MPRFALVLPSIVALVSAAAASAQTARRPLPAPPPPPAAAPSAPAESGRRVIVSAVTAPIYTCAAVTCRVLTDLDKGVVLSVVKSEGPWHQVMVRTATNAMTTGWVQASNVGATAAGTARAVGPERTDGVLRPPADAAAGGAAGEEDPRGCLTCLATRTATRDEWDAALADTATRKARPDDRVATGLADGRTSDERMRDLFAERYGEEVGHLSKAAASVDADLETYLSACVARFASIPVEGAAPRSTQADEMLKAARAFPGAARYQLWNGTAAFAWRDDWDPTPDPNSTLPSCPRLWEDARSRAERLKVDLEFLERDAREHSIYPGIVREALAAQNLLPPEQLPPSAPVTNLK